MNSPLNKDLKMETVPDCPLCKSREQKHIFDDWEGNSYVRCLNCSLVFQNPRKITKYEDEYWKETVIDPDGKMRYPKEEREYQIKNSYQHVLNFVKDLKGGTVLDAGCGYAFFLSALDKKWVKYGIDASVSLVDYIKQNYPEINIRQGNLEEDVFDANRFDLVFSHGVMEHIINPDLIIRQFYRVLKPNGILILTTPNIDSFCARRFKGNFRVLGAPHTIMFSPKTLKKALEDNGFKVFKKQFPYFKTSYFTLKNIIRLFNKNKISPPFYGNMMTLYVRKV